MAEFWGDGTAKGCNEDGQVEPRRPDGESLLSWTKGDKGLDWDDGDGGRKLDIHETELESHGNELREGGKIEHDFNHNQYKTC